MITFHGNLWDTDADIILVTGNATTRTDGCLVMGRGAALEASRKHPDCPKVFGDLIHAYSTKYLGSRNYGILIHPTLENPRLGIFQVKLEWWEPARKALIERSLALLTVLANGKWANSKIAMNCPGIGSGKLSRLVVMPLLQVLPKNVEIWEYPIAALTKRAPRRKTA